MTEDSKTSATVRQKIRSWLHTVGIKTEDRDVARAAWTILVSDPGGRKISIIQPSDRPGLILLRSGILPDEATQNRLSGLSSEARANFIWDLRFELMRLGVEFDGIQWPLARVGIQSVVLVEDLGASSFMDLLWRHRSACVTVQWMIDRALQSEPKAIDMIEPHLH